MLIKTSGVIYPTLILAIKHNLELRPKTIYLNMKDNNSNKENTVILNSSTIAAQSSIFLRKNANKTPIVNLKPKTSFISSPSQTMDTEQEI